jgi:hypothetical protein
LQGILNHSSAQTKFQRVLKAVDYIFSKLERRLVSDDMAKATEIFIWIFVKTQRLSEFHNIWTSLSTCLDHVQVLPNSSHIATILLPAIKSLMVGC